MARASVLSGTTGDPEPSRAAAPQTPGPHGAVLELAAAVFLGLALLCALGPIDDFFTEPPVVAYCAGGAFVLGMACLYAAGDARRRRPLVAIAAAALSIAVAQVGAMLAFADTAGDVDVWFVHTTVETLLWCMLGAGAAIALGLVVLARREATPAPADRAELTGAERRLGRLLAAFAALFAPAAAAFAAGPFIGSTDELARQLPFIAGAVAFFCVLALLCAYAAADLRGSMALAGPVIAAQAGCAVVLLVYLVALSPDYSVSVLGANLDMTALLAGLAAFHAVAAIVLQLAYHAAWKARYQLRYFWPGSYRALLAVADVLVAGRQEQVSVEDIGRRVEAFLNDFHANRRGFYRIALGAIQLAPLLILRPRPGLSPPLSELDPARCRWFLEHQYERLPKQSPVRLIKHFKQVTIRICQQLSYAGYYGNPDSFESVNYVPFSERTRVHPHPPVDPGPHNLKVTRSEELDGDELRAEVCIVGSGAGGAVLAHQLAELGRDVLILERGQYVEPRHFVEDEIEMISKLYADGLMQQSEDWRFTILQGSCVGGSTTVNNAVCFPPPPLVLAKWNDWGAGLDLQALGESVQAVEKLVGVEDQSKAPLNPSGQRFIDGALKLGVSPDQLEAKAVRANITHCLGCGYCNIGCKWGRKLSMLDRVLPLAQALPQGTVRIVADCPVERILTDGGSPKRVKGLRAKLPDGRTVAIQADTYVLSAGVVASSYLLLKSKVGRGLPVGKRFSANMGAPLTAEFEEPQHAYDGLQISHYGRPTGGDGYVFETWFNPPVAQALNLPGWFEEHFENMLRYDHLMAVGALVGTESNGSIGRALTGGPGVDFKPTPDDLEKLAKALVLLGRILFEAGAERVMINTWGKDEFRKPAELEALHEICADPDYVALGTGHPQGGNAISDNPERGVVDPDFRVHGYANLYVCDASVFPTSLTVNPQLTVMSLAHYAAPRIA